MQSNAMLHSNTVQYIFLLAFQVKPNCDDHQVAAEQKNEHELLYRPGRNLHDDTFINCHHIKRQQQTGACWWLQNQQKHVNVYIL